MLAKKRTKTQAQMAAELAAMQTDFEAWRAEEKLRRGCPSGWTEIEAAHKTAPRKTRMTIRVDADVAGWFRAQGRGYQVRVNAVLRAYMLARRADVI